MLSVSFLYWLFGGLFVLKFKLINMKKQKISWQKIKDGMPKEDKPILIAFREYGRPKNKYKVRESVKRGVFYFHPDYNEKKSNEYFYDPDFWMYMPNLPLTHRKLKK